MKAGILYSDMVNTVSEGYAREIQTPEYGGRMDGIMVANSGKLRGILNGLDYNVWNPETDQSLAVRYNIQSSALRARNKATLQRELGLEEELAKFLLGFVGRMSIQKGVDIFVPAVPELLGMGLQMAVLGSGDEHYQDMMNQIAGDDPAHLKVVLGFDDGLARRIYAGCDAFLMPSRYEPCGLGQMISFRYGAVPIVRRTGGLADTVTDASVSDEGTGFVFNEYSASGLVSAVERAMQAFHDRPRWNALVMKGMSQDFSWRASAGKYIDAYREIINMSRPQDQYP
jgi:starch synthase